MAFKISFTLYSYAGHRRNVGEFDPFCLTVGFKTNRHIDNVFRGWKLALALILVKLDIEQMKN